MSLRSSREPLEGYTDRFYLPLSGKMDWHHTIRETEGGREVTFEPRGLRSLGVDPGPDNERHPAR